MSIIESSSERSFLSGLSNERRQALYHHSTGRSVLQSAAILAIYITLYIGGGLLNSTNVFPFHWIFIWPTMGFILAGFLGAIHDCTHNTQWKIRSVNRWAGALWCAPVLLNFTIYKHYHLAHHRHTSVEGDTEPQGEFDSLWSYVRAIPCISFFKSFWKMSVTAATAHELPDFVPQKSRSQVRGDNIVLACWILLVGSLLIAYPLELMSGYLIPLAISYPLVFLTSIPEHYGCEESDDIWRNTRTVVSSKIFRFFFWNGNYHAEHHLLPGVPSQNLSTLHSVVGHRICFVEKSYIAFHMRLIHSLWRHANSQEKVTLDPTVRVIYESRKNGDPQAK